MSSGLSAIPTTNPSTFQTNISPQFQYQGRPAYRIDTLVKQLNSTAGDGLDNPIDVEEDGVLIGFTVAVNNPLIRVDAVVYGSATSFTTLNDMDMGQVTDLGRGLTRGQAEAVSPQGVSLDIHGQKDDIWPWIQRYKSTYSLNHLNDTYNAVKGTLLDKWIVLAYTPTLKESYTRFALDITNTDSADALIHRFQVSRIKFANTGVTATWDTPSSQPVKLAFQ